MFYRLLLGPYDQSKSDDAGLLGSQHQLSPWRSKGFFRDRVSDGATDATVEADIGFGKNILTVRRRLNTLQIETLTLNGQPLDDSQDVYQETIIQLSGTATFFDFFAILRYLVFFLEDRVELIWDRRSQFDMLRILLFDTAAAKAAAEAYDAAQSADSHFRNRRNIHNKDRDRLKDLEAIAGHAQASELRALQTAIAEAEDRDREQARKVADARESVEGARLRRERALLDLQEARIALEYEEQAHYKHLFPDLDETAHHVFLNLLGGGGCLVCGTTGADVANHLRDKLEHHRCPICDSPSERHEKVTAPADFSRARLRRLKAKVDQLREAVKVATADIDAAEKEHEQFVERREEDRQQMTEMRVQLAKLGFIDLPSDADLESLRTTVSEGEKEVARLEAERSAAEARYGRVVKKQKGLIDQMVGVIRRRFREYASLVLAERCELNITKERRSIGQDGEKFEFPYFEVMMTSGVFDQSLSTRHSADAVSESQREFLDIAFRLALISSVTGEKADSMLVLETPEASLDSLFVTKAGEAFRRYAENKRRNNVLIASTNLNNEEMLSALLGVHDLPARERRAATDPVLGARQQVRHMPAPIVPPAERQRRIINLLELAAPNAALKQYRAYYRKLLQRALGGRRSA
jgi:rubrerythrin